MDDLNATVSDHSSVPHSRDGDGVFRVVDTDRYGRTVGVIYHDKRNINLVMIQEGHAWWYRKYAQYDRQLQGAEAEARDAKRGLWAEPDPIPPWEWRRNQH